MFERVFFIFYFKRNVEITKRDKNKPYFFRKLFSTFYVFAVKTSFDHFEKDFFYCVFSVNSLLIKLFKNQYLGNWSVIEILLKESLLKIFVKIFDLFTKRRRINCIIYFLRSVGGKLYAWTNNFWFMVGVFKWQLCERILNWHDFCFKNFQVKIKFFE